MKTLRSWLGLVGVALGLGVGPVWAQYQVVHQFAGGPLDGGWPYDSLTIVGTNMYGMTYGGGSASCGVVASDLGILHTFTNGPGDGAYPLYGSLAVAGATLYGMTTLGGTAGSGTLFKVSTTGTGYGVLHHFPGGTNDGAQPYATPTVVGTNLYGTTTAGGNTDDGVLFAINTNGTSYRILHHFGSATTDGRIPYAAPVAYGGVLYGTTFTGGTNGGGTIYKVNLDGSGYAVLVQCEPLNGVTPRGELVKVGNALYGLMCYGSGDGTVFKVDTNGNNYTVLHTFHGGVNDGANPCRSLTVLGSVLYGTTLGGGINNKGTIFKIGTNGTGFAVLHSFAGGTNDGDQCYCNLTQLEAVLYGLTVTGGSNSVGTVFALAIPGPKLFYQEPAGTVAGWILESNGLFQTAYILGNTGGWKVKAAGDINGDGIADLLFQTAAGDTGGWFMGSDGQPRDRRFWWNIGNWEIRACADYDNDGRAEIFFQRPDGMAAFWTVATNGDFVSSTLLGAMGAWQLRAAGDLDGDGKAEVFWQQSTGLVAVWFHDGAGGSIRSQVMINTGAWQLRAAADMDYDGVTDLLWQTPDGRTGGWFMNPNATAKAASFWWGTGLWRLSAAGKQ